SPTTNAAVYTVTNLVTDGNAFPATTQDANLVNPWGLAFGPDTFAWISDNGPGVATLYDGHGTPVPLIVTIPAPASGGPAHPTGVVYNGSNQFNVTDGTTTAPARFIFATERGIIAGWSPGVPPPPPSTQAFVAVDNSPDESIYKGLTIAGGFGSGDEGDDDN